MSNKKDRMLNHIKNNTGWFMDAANVKVIPYTDLTRSTFNNVKSSFAYQAEYDDVVCLISTSILDDGRCGVLFTTDSVYTKAWVPFGISTAYKCNYWEGYLAEFSNVLNDFHVERMREMLSDLFDIGCEEDEKERKREEATERLEKLGEVGQVVGGLLLLGMATTEIVAFVSEMLVDSNNEAIMSEVCDILDSLETEDFDF